MPQHDWLAAALTHLLINISGTPLAFLRCACLTTDLFLSCFLPNLTEALCVATCPAPSSLPSSRRSSAMAKKHVITIICVVNLLAGRRRKRGIVVAVAPSHLQTSGLVYVMSPASISDSFRPTVRPSVHSPPYLLCSEVAGLRPKVPLRKKKLSRFNHVGVGCFSPVSSHK